MSLLTFRNLKWASFTHSAIYLALLSNSLVFERDGPGTVLGWAHGVGWILMSLAVLAAVPRRVVSLRLAVAVAVIGGVGPFVGSIAFVLEERRGFSHGRPHSAASRKGRRASLRNRVHGGRDRDDQGHAARDG